MKKVAMILSAIALAPVRPAAAPQELGAAFQEASQTVAAGGEKGFKLSASAVAQQKIAAARARLRQQKGVGADLLSELDALRIGVVVGGVHGRACGLVSAGDETFILCGDGLSGQDPAYAALRIAEPAAERRLRSMPDTVERDYLIISLMTRTWIEAGGQIMRDQAMSRRMSAWWNAHGLAAFRSTAAPGKATLSDLLAAKLEARERVGAEWSQAGRAGCAYAERALLRELEGAEGKMRALDKEIAGLRFWEAYVELFEEKERVWIDARRPT